WRLVLDRGGCYDGSRVGDRPRPRPGGIGRAAGRGPGGVAMTRAVHPWTAPAAFALLAWTAAGAPAPPGAPANGGKKDDNPAEKVKKALAQTTEVAFENQPLETAVNSLAETAKVNLVIDRWTIQQLGLDPMQMQVNLKLKDAKISTALRSALNPYNLSYAVI